MVVACVMISYSVYIHFGVDGCAKGLHRPAKTKHEFEIFLDAACTLLYALGAGPFVIVLAYALSIEYVKGKKAHLVSNRGRIDLIYRRWTGNMVFDVYS